MTVMLHLMVLPLIVVATKVLKHCKKLLLEEERVSCFQRLKMKC